MRKAMRTAWRSLGPALVLCASGCGDRAAEEPIQQTPAESDRVAQSGASIMRPEVEAEATVAAPPEPLTASLPFPEHGFEVSDAARRQLMPLLEAALSEQQSKIILRGHSDSVGSDRANLVASRRRAEAVRDVMLEQGVSADRIEVIALGEMRPAAPNAHLDGSPDEEGRARNRRVDVEIVPLVETQNAPGETPRLAPEDAAPPADAAERESPGVGS